MSERIETALPIETQPHNTGLSIGKLIVSATFTAEPIEEPLRFWMRELDLNFEIEFAPYNQVFQTLLDPNSVMRRSKNSYNVLFVRFEDWQQFAGDSPASTKDDLERNVEELIAAVKTAAGENSATYILCCCPPSHSLATDLQWVAFFLQMQEKLIEQLKKSGNIHVITPRQISDLYPVAEYEDRYANEVGHVPYTTDFFTALATIVIRRIWGLIQPQYKVLVLDCDNTLWSGVCGEDGTLGVAIDAPRLALQEAARMQREQGMLLCLCSKNNEKDVWDVFEQNPGMLLRREEITGHRINWGQKSKNLRSLAQELGLGLDSFVFVDDNPFECAEVEAECPEVLTLQIPEQAAQIANFLRHVWAFDHFRSTGVDRLRSELYKDNQHREQLRQSQSLDEFIENLQLEVTIAPLSEETVSRVAQLTQRTNQFNFTTVRRQDSQIHDLLSGQPMRCLTVNLRDRFGDYGLIGVVIYGFDKHSLEVDTFLLSCRALGRRVEHTILDRLCEEARGMGVEWIYLRFSPTSKNTPAIDFLENIQGATKLFNGSVVKYRLSSSTSSTAISNTSVVDMPPENFISLPEQLEPPEDESPRRREKESGANAPILARIALQFGSVAPIMDAINSQRPRQTRSKRHYVPPRGEFEESIADVWAKLLRVDRVGLLDDFFLLGGNSLLATQMMSRVSQQCGARLPITSIFNNTTLELFVRATKSAVSGGTYTELPLSGVVRTEQLPLSYGQQRLWFLDQWQPGQHVYNVPLVFRVRGALHVDVLHRSLVAVVARHESLRSTFHVSAGHPVQRIHEITAAPLRLVDLRQHGGEKDEQAMKFVTEEMRRPFDLSRDVLLRGIAIQLQEEDFLLALGLHHIAADGWSLDILFCELSSFYNAFLENRALELEPLPIQFVDYAVWQRNYLTGAVLDEQLKYWHRQLDGAAPQLKLPNDLPRPATQSFRGALLPFTFPRELATIVSELCRTEEVTPFIALLTVLQVLLRQYCGQNDISIGSPIANRTSIETEGLIGFFANTLVLRSVFPRDPSFREMLAIARETALGAYAHQYMPFEKLVEILKPPRAGYNPLFQVNFRVLTASSTALQFGSTTAERIHFDPGISRFDLALELLVTTERFEGFFEYSVDLFYPQTIQRLKSDFEKILRILSKRPDVPLSTLGLDRLVDPIADRGSRAIRKRAAKPTGVPS